MPCEFQEFQLVDCPLGGGYVPMYIFNVRAFLYCGFFVENRGLS